MDLVKVFAENDTEFSTPCLYQIPCRKAIVTETNNGDYYLEIEIDNDQIKYLSGNCIFGVYHLGALQAFRMGYEERISTYSYFKCWHISYDMKTFLVGDITIEDTALGMALTSIKNATTDTNPFIFSTTSSLVHSTELHYKDLYTVIMDIVDKYSLEIVRDNYEISLVAKRGTNNERTIEYRKNLISASKISNTADLVTKLYPTMVWNETTYGIDATYIQDTTLYSRKYIRTMQFEPTNPDKLQEYTDSISSAENTITALTNDSSNALEAKNQDTNGVATYQAKVDENLSGISEFMDYFVNLLKTDSTTLANAKKYVLAHLYSAYTLMLSHVNTFANSVATTESSIATLNNNLTLYQAKYRAYTDKGLTTKARAYKENIDITKAQIEVETATLLTQKTEHYAYQMQYARLKGYYDVLTSDSAWIYNTLTRGSLLFYLRQNYDFIKSIAVKKYPSDSDKVTDVMQTVSDTIDVCFDKEVPYFDRYRQDYIMQNATDRITALTDHMNTVNSTLSSAIKSDLLSQAQTYLAKYKYEQVVYEVDALIDEVAIGDYIIVKNSKLGVDIDARVICIKYNCMTNRIYSIQFGNTDYSLSSQQKIYENRINALEQSYSTKATNLYNGFKNQVNILTSYYSGK